MDYKIIKDHPWLKKDNIISSEELSVVFTSTGIFTLINESVIEEIIIKQSQDELKALIVGNVKDLISTFLYEDREEDEDLQLGDIENAIKDGLINPTEIIDIFTNELLECLKE